MMKKGVVIAVLAGLVAPSYAAQGGWVTVDNLNRRTCPSSDCGVVGSLMFREKARALEEVNGWVRISKYYDALCKNGKSQHVDAGNKNCEASNGINDGKLAEWVYSKYLSATRPADPAATASADYDLVKGSDDFRVHKDAFASAANQLVASGKCTAKDFRDMGGWLKSTNQKTKPVYFTYCGNDQFYLNAATGTITQ